MFLLWKGIGYKKTGRSKCFSLLLSVTLNLNQDYDDKYTKLNAYFGVPPQMRPVITDEVKYDYNRADEMVAAHNAYLAK